MTQISVCIIAKNEEKHIEKCLKAIMPYGFEIIVTDTGSTDRTKEIAAKYADKVLDYTWTNDFAAARNFSLAQATNDYVLILDCDEVVTKLDMEEIQQLIAKYPAAVGLIARDNHYTSNRTDSVYRDHVERLFNRKYYHYESPIHEQVTHNQNGMRYASYELPLVTDHVGYTGTQEELQAKVERNNSLLLQELEKDPDNPYLYFQIGQSYNMIYDYENSYRYYKKALEYDVNPQAEWVQMMIIAYGNAMLHTGREEEALLIENIYEEFNTTADFLCLMGRIYMVNQKFMRAMMEFLKAIHCPTARETGTNSYIPTYNMGLINEMMGKRDAALTLYKNCGDFPMALERIRELEQT